MDGHFFLSPSPMILEYACVFVYHMNMPELDGSD